MNLNAFAHEQHEMSVQEQNRGERMLKNDGSSEKKRDSRSQTQIKN
jgi:hypothetical protein